MVIVSVGKVDNETPKDEVNVRADPVHFPGTRQQYVDYVVDRKHSPHLIRGQLVYVGQLVKRNPRCMMVALTRCRRNAIDELMTLGKWGCSCFRRVGSSHHAAPTRVETQSFV